MNESFTTSGAEGPGKVAFAGRDVMKGSFMTLDVMKESFMTSPTPAIRRGEKVVHRAAQAWPVSKRATLPSRTVNAHRVRIAPHVEFE